MDQQQIAKKLEELDALKAKVEKLLSLSEIGQDVRKELEEFKELRSKEGLTEEFNIRVAVEGGGCSGLMYNLDFAAEAQPNDMIFEDKGVKVMVDKKSILYLAGTELDFSDGLNGKGFQFKNPNASRTCGCGESFSI